MNVLCYRTEEQTQEVVYCDRCLGRILEQVPVDDYCCYVLGASEDARCESCAAHYGRILRAECGQ